MLEIASISPTTMEPMQPPITRTASGSIIAMKRLRRIAHFHFNVMPDARSLRTILELTGRYFDFLRSHGESRVFGQIVSFEGRRGAALFERHGFTLLNKAEITKYRDVYPEKVFLCTVMKELGS